MTRYLCLALAILTCFATTKAQTCAMDVVFIIDASDTTRAQGIFNNFQQFIFSFVNGPQFATNNVRVGIVYMNDNQQSTVQIPLSGDRNFLISQISSSSNQLGGGLLIANGLQGAINIFSSARTNIPQVAVVITAGRSFRGAIPNFQANSLKGAIGSGSVYAIGIQSLGGALYNINELQTIASVFNFFSNINSNNLVQTFATIYRRICIIPTTPPPTVDVCTDCHMESGVGYVPHESDCQHYYQCIEQRDGPPLAVLQVCPEKQYWNKFGPNCDVFLNTPCNVGQCDAGKTFLFRSINNCGMYYNCTNNKVTDHCCGQNSRFDATSQSCVQDVTCDQCNMSENDPRRLCNTATYQPTVVNGIIDPCGYNVDIGGHIYKMKCAAGTHFTASSCSCSEPVNYANDTQCNPQLRSRASSCTADFLMNFNGDQIKDEIHNSWVGRKGVNVLNGHANFDGQNKNRLFVLRYSANDFTLPLAIKVIFKDSAAIADMAVLSTGGCLDAPSLYITSGNNRVTVGLVATKDKINTPLTTTVSNLPANTWKEVKMLYDGTKLTAEVTSLNDNFQTVAGPTAFPVKTTAAGSRILKVLGALQLGYAEDVNFPGFQGRVTELKVWRGCKNQLLLNQYS